jgi:hypothetical protein
VVWAGRQYPFAVAEVLNDSVGLPHRISMMGRGRNGAGSIAYGVSGLRFTCRWAWEKIPSEELGRLRRF